MRKIGLLFLIAVALPILAACGSDPTPTPKPVATATAAPQLSLEEQLYKDALATNSGKIAWVFPTRAAQGEPIVEAFEAQYPGLKVELTTKSTSEVTEGLLLENKAGKISAEGADPGRDSRLLDQNIFADSTDIFDDIGVDKLARYGDGAATLYLPLAHGVMYNTDVINADEVPQTYEDLLDPKWKGQMVLEDRLKGFIYLTDLPEYNGKFPNLWTEAKIVEYLGKLKDQKPAIMHGNTTVGNAVSSGEFPISPDVNIASIGNAIQKGAPVDMAPVTPNAIEQWLIGAVAKGPNPPGGKLFLRWLNNVNQGIPVRVKVQPGTSMDPASGDLMGVRMSKMDLKIGYTGIEMADNFKRLQKTYREVLGIPTS